MHLQIRFGGSISLQEVVTTACPHLINVLSLVEEADFFQDLQQNLIWMPGLILQILHSEIYLSFSIGKIIQLAIRLEYCHSICKLVKLRNASRIHGSKLRSQLPTRRAPFHIGCGIAAPIRVRCAKRYIKGSKNSEKIMTNPKKM